MTLPTFDITGKTYTYTASVFGKSLWNKPVDKWVLNSG